MSHDDETTNTSGNRPFQDVLATYRSRRTVLVGGVAMATATFFASGGYALAGDDDDDDEGRYRRRRRNYPLVDFTPSENNDDNLPQISPDYEYDIILPWGDPINPDSGPAFSHPPTADAQAEQIGIGHDGMAYFAINGGGDDDDDYRGGDDDDDDDSGRGRYYGGRRYRRFFRRHSSSGNRRGVLCMNNEFGRNSAVLGKDSPESLEDVRASQHAHGVTVVELKKMDGKWQNVESRYARRIHVNTPVAFSGPAAGTSLLDTPAGNEPKGTVNNCAMGRTPWGTYLTCEENFNGYFGSTDPNWEANSRTERQARYGFSNNGFGYGWQNFDERFDLSNPEFANEDHRFGWVMEIDPMDPDRKPVKRTALGRMKHEGATVTVGRGGRVVVYMGDDQRFDYIYKFVSAYNWKSMVRRGRSPLDKGKLYVAKFNDDGSGEWLRLTIRNPILAAEFSSQAEVLTYARVAADLLGATPMDRPEWTAVAPNGDVYVTLTNNSQRTEPTAPNPEAPNSDGHIIRLVDSRRNTGRKFEWNIFLLASETRGTAFEFTDPDGLFADSDGRLFIQTDGGQPNGQQDQMVVADTTVSPPVIRRLFAGVSGDEITGITHTPDRRTYFVNIQHPGVILPGIAGPVPRDSTVVITKKDGGIVGS